jgi:metal-responsive CopG/Arc/MetJ family transcriptional regulator
LEYNSKIKDNTKVIHVFPSWLQTKVEAMKIKTSITLPVELVREMDEWSDHYGTRSALIEQAVREFFAAVARRTRDARDVEILNQRAAALNAEATEVLAYQVEL